MTNLSRRSVLALGLATATLVVLPGCNTQLQKNTDVLLDALEKGDYASLKAIAGPKLLEDVDEAKFNRMSAVYKGLGKLKDKTRTSTSIRNGVRSIHYDLTFDKGSIELDVTALEENTLDGFKFEGKLWTETAESIH